MNEYSDILDQNFGQPVDKKKVQECLASQGDRFINFLIDAVLSYIMFIVIIIVLMVNMGDEVLIMLQEYNQEFSYSILLIYIVYYTLMEFYFGKTIGKFLTKTTVVNRKGIKPDFLNLLGRSLCRMIPFEPFSILFSGRGIGWHDSISETYIVKDKKFYVNE